MVEKDPSRCPDCRGTGQVLLLFSWAICRTCGGTGALEEELEEDLEDTGEFETFWEEQELCCGKTTDCCDPESCPEYFDDGLEFDDDEWGSGDDVS